MRIFRHHIHMPIATLAFVEALALFSVLYLAAALRFEETLAEVEARLGPLWSRALLFAAILLVGMIATGLYTVRLRATRAGILLRVLTSVVAGTLLLVIFYYAFPSLYMGRGVMLISAVLAFVSIAAIRLTFDRLVDEELFKRRVLVYGCGRQAMSISQLRRRSDRRGFVIVGYVQSSSDTVAAPVKDLFPANTPLLELVAQHHVDEIVVAMDERRHGFPVHELLECRLNGIDVVDVVSFLERETGKVRLEVLNPSHLIFSDGFRRNPLRLLSERAFDVVTSLLLLAAALPVMLLTALAIKLEEGPRAPVFYRQKRVGFQTRLFDMLKFRSMRVDAEKDGQAQWAQKGDSRATRVGAFIRKVRIDELPQVINVLKGDMSFVGPRPERPEFVNELNEKIPYYRERHYVKPGITGWAQLCYPYGSSEHDAVEKLQYDLYYVKNHSLLFDLMILLQTAEVILWRKGGR